MPARRSRSRRPPPPLGSREDRLACLRHRAATLPIADLIDELETYAGLIEQALAARAAATDDPLESDACNRAAWGLLPVRVKLTGIGARYNARMLAAAKRGAPAPVEA